MTIETFDDLYTADMVTDEIETFDNMGDSSGEPQGKEATKTSKREENPSVITKQHELLDEKKEENPKPTKTDKKDKMPESKEGPTDGDKAGSEEDGENKKVETQQTPAKKAFRIKAGDSTFDIDPEATIKVPVDGKSEFFTLQELRDNMSGKVAWTNRINSANRELETVKKQSQEFQRQRDEVYSAINKAVELMDDETKNPLDGLKLLLDHRGVPSYKYIRRLFEAQSEELDKIAQMDEKDRAIYWREQEIEHLRNIQTANQKAQEQAKAEKERLHQVDQLRDKYGISVEQFLDTENALIADGFGDKLTPETVVMYAAQKPHYEKAEKICEGYQEEMTDDEYGQFLTGVARLSFSHPKLSDEALITAVADQLGFEVITSDLEEHIKGKLPSGVREVPSKKPAPKEADHLESFDDFY